MNMLEIQVKALRAVAIATVAGCDAFLAMVAEAEAAAPPPGEEKVYDMDPAKCQHPREAWKRAPAMGKPNRMVCRCGTEVEEPNS